jgi:CcmD family protein
MGNLWYLALAYGVIWVVLLAYLYSIARRQESLRREIKAIEEALKGEPGDEEEAGEAEPFLTLVQGKGTPREGPARARSARQGRPGSC